MRSAGEREPGTEPVPGRSAAVWTIVGFAAATVLMAVVQFRLVLHILPRPATLVTPALVGAAFGALFASLRAARARERSMARSLAAAQEARFEAMARLAGGVGHDLDNLFAVAQACAGCVRGLAAKHDGGACGGCVAAVDDLDAALERARDISRQLVMLSRPSGAPAEPIDVRHAIRALAPVLRRVLGSGVRLDVVGHDAAHVRVDRTELEQVVVNLAVNARDAMPGGGTLSVGVRREGDAVLLSVRDTGVGMDEDTRARMFEPFFTTKPPGKGTGLGLMVVAHVVQRARGRIAVRSAPREGTEVTIAFDAAHVPPAPAARAG
jgi:signal transduction histidine kinase